MPKAKEVRYDLDFSSPLPTASQISAVASFVSSKGFCAIKWDVPAATLAAVVEEVKRLKLNKELQPLPAELDDGFLGAEGSSAMLVGLDANAAFEGLDSQFTTITEKMTPIMRTIVGPGATTKSPTALHITGEPEDEDDRPELADAEAQKHLTLFTTHRLMLVYFLGPGQGTMEMEPFGVFQVNPFSLVTEPGMLLVLRADMLSHRHFSTRETSAISCFISQECADAPVRTPTSDLLRSFAKERMSSLRAQKELEGFEDSQIVPKEWEEVVSKNQSLGPQVAARALSAKFPGSWDAQAWWYMTAAGIDLLTEVPYTRWSVADEYDPDPDSYKQWKTCSKHCAYIDGLQLFDNKFFSLSTAETKTMDPQQRHILEVSYDALQQTGFTKKALMRSLIGVYLGCSCQMEWGMVSTGESDAAGSATTGGSASINSNRISFCLGMQGPSYTLDLQANASMAAVTNGYNSQKYQTDRYMPCHTAVAGGMYLSFVAANFVLCCAQGFMSNRGRCLTYDATANGWAKGEGLSVMTMQKEGEVVDGKTVVEDKPFLAAVAGSVVSHTGAAASLNAPNGPVEQLCVLNATRQAQLSPCDVDGMEPVGDGRFLFDAAEVMGSSNALRLNESKPLILCSVKTTSGMMHEVTGMAQMMRIIYSLRAGIFAPSNHLHELNEHIDVWADADIERPVQFATEALGVRNLKSFMGCSARAHGGTIGCVIFGVDLDTKLRPSYTARAALPELAFWPGGGGKLDDAAKPKDTYHIVGSWTSFCESSAMEKEGKDLFSYIVTIGANGFEQFQICLDGDMDKMLTPEAPVAAAYSSVQGPVSQDGAKGLEWVIGAPVSHICRDTLTNGACNASPGEKYMVKLRIAGKWRTVDWVRIEPAKSDAQPRDDGQYFIAASWSSWACAQQLVEVGPGQYQADVALPSSRGRFQVVRNKDWSQAFYPDGIEVMGPGSAASSSGWTVEGSSGDIVRIVLQRLWKNASWSQTVSWEKTGSKPSLDLAAPSWPRFFLVGAGSTVKLELEPVSALSYSITLHLTDGNVPFQILYDGDFRRVFYPSVKSATQSVPHKILGPDLPLGCRSSWLVKRDLDDTSKDGGWYTVELAVRATDHMPAAVRWMRVA